jgi:hypothetical protein
VSSWVIVGLLLNVAVVAAAVVLVLRLAGPRSVESALAARAELRWNRLAILEPARHADRILAPSLNPTETRRIEWLALLDAFNSAHAVYKQELAAWRVGPRRYGALSRAKHTLDVARRRLNRFERERVVQA